MVTKAKQEQPKNLMVIKDVTIFQVVTSLKKIEFSFEGRFGPKPINFHSEA